MTEPAGKLGVKLRYLGCNEIGVDHTRTTAGRHRWPTTRETSARGTEPVVRAGTVSCMKVEVVQADITNVQVDVIVTAANSPLIGGGGVDGAVHRVAGGELLQALRPLSPCPVGGAAITPAFRFPPPVRHIVHAVGPRYGVDERAAELLAGAYQASLTLAGQVDAESIAFPSLSTRAFYIRGWRLPESASRRCGPLRQKCSAVCWSRST